jgi:hypothetical protein
LFWSSGYVGLRRVLQLAALRFRSKEFKELEIVGSAANSPYYGVKLVGLS